MFDRLELLIGKENIEKLNKKKVMLLGLGGVGGNAFEALVRSGIGTIIIVDNDIFDETNLNRQILSNKEVIGKNKVDVAEERAKSINEKCKIIKIKEFITQDNIKELFKYNIDFLIDAIDTIDTKKLIIKKCIKQNINFISSMGCGNRMHPEQLEITTLDKTSYDPVAKQLRKYIKEEHINKKIKVVASKEQPMKIKKVGSNAFVPAVSGLLCASCAINTLLKEDK